MATYEDNPNIRKDDNSEGVEALSRSLRIGLLWIYVLAVVMIAIVAAQSFVIVKQHEKAVITRFGKIRTIAGTGLHLAFPYPVEQAQVFEVTRTRQIQSGSFLFRAGGVGEEVPPTLKPGADGYVITGDMNILHLKCSLAYLVDPESDQAILEYFVLSPDPELALGRIFDGAIVRAAAESSADDILLRPDKFRSRIASELRASLEKSALKILFEERDISIIASPPRQAKASFDALAQASQNQETLANEAESFRISTQREAVTERDSILAAAQSEGGRKVFAAKAEAETFAERVAQFEKNPELVAGTIYQDTLFRIAKGVDEKFIAEGSEGRQLRILLGRKPEIQGKAKDK